MASCLSNSAMLTPSSAGHQTPTVLVHANRLRRTVSPLPNRYAQPHRLDHYALNRSTRPLTVTHLASAASAGAILAEHEPSDVNTQSKGPNFNTSGEKDNEQRHRDANQPAASASNGENGTATSTASPAMVSQQLAEERSASPNMMLLPISVCKTITLAAQATLADGARELLHYLPAAVADHTAFPSGVLRLEVAVPRTAATSLRWLAGQQQKQHHDSGKQQQQPGPPQLAVNGDDGGGGDVAAAEGSASVRNGPWFHTPAASGPFVYFSGRRSSAPDTPGACAAEAATRGWSAVAGAGAAWQWGGEAAGGFDGGVVSQLQRFLSADQPRVRILGGARFDPNRTPDPEWAPFGSHCFMLPLLELLEAEDACLLAVTLAWDPAAAEAGAGAGAARLVDAAARGETALRQMAPPAPPSAYSLHVSRSEPQHAPSRSEWDEHMAALLSGLQDREDTGAPAAAQLASMLDPGVARQEYLTNGQQGLDDLLAAMTLSASAAAAAAGARQSVDGDGLDALRDLIDGKLTVSELKAAAAAAAAAAAESSMSSSQRLSPSGPLTGVGGTDGASMSAAVGAGVLDDGNKTGGQDGEELSKVVMARRTSIKVQGPLDPLHVLMGLQERDPRAYQLYFAPGAGPGSATTSTTSSTPVPGPAFLACTPERLYARTGRYVASEAVAGTRPRGKGGDVEQDFWLSLDLLRSPKDDAEFCTVRDWIASQLAGPCDDVVVEIRKSVLKQSSVQHLFGRVAAALRRGRNDAHLLAALHPTPAVCGRPREAALGYLNALESFDRGWYAGPFGWMSGAGAEFVVAIRSGLVCPEHTLLPNAAPQPPMLPAPVVAPSSLVHMFAGVGVVRGSDPSAEWQELDLKIRPLSSALLAAPAPASAPNINVAWAGLLVEELCRLGVNMFCVAPGSRSSPLTHAIATHPRARLNVCIDERSLGFWALGYGRAAGRPVAVVTSSGTAVANLLPAVVEASLSGVPLLLLTADRPGELRDTAANQTIDQTKIFGGFVRWFFDLPPPSPEVPGRTILTTASTAFRAAVSSAPPGPVHLNLQFREPLAPVAVSWPVAPLLAGLGPWQASQLPYTSHITGAALPAAAAGAGQGSGSRSDVGGVGWSSGGADVAALRALLAGARRGLVVVGELTDPRDIMAARQIGAALGWPVVADVLSGLRVGAPAPPPTWGSAAAATTSPLTAPPNATIRSFGNATTTTTIDHGYGYSKNNNSSNLYVGALPVVHHMDQLLLGDRGWWRALRPDVVLQLGPHLTSKRLGQFMDWAALGDAEDASVPAPWLYVAPHTLRHDPSHLVTHRAVMTLPEFRDAVVAPVAAVAAAASQSGPDPAAEPWGGRITEYGRMLLQLDAAVSHEVDAALASLTDLSEPFIARTLARALPSGHGLFIGNSMPIRDMEMYAAPQPAGAGHPASSGTRTGAGTGAAPNRAAAVPNAFGAGSGVVGVPVGANRGASGIDGVLSTAAGFAEGLSRPTSLLLGDLSFLHDINGLNLLRAGELRPPLTVVLVNNAGGGIFSFLPIAASVPDDEFTPLWATPQNVDLEAMCRAQGIPHQKVTSPEALVPALQAAWGLNRHSVVEVITDRTTNVELHRKLQAAAIRAAQHAYQLARLSSAAAATAMLAPQGILSITNHLPASSSLAAAGVMLRAGSLSWRRYSLPLTQRLTTTTLSSGRDPGQREGLLLRLTLTWPDGRPAGAGLGEVAPLPGLHSETLDEAVVQVAALSELLEGVLVPPSLALLGGRLSAWLRGAVGLRDPAWISPSVRFGLEFALLSALATSLGTTLAQLLSSNSTQSSTLSACPSGHPEGSPSHGTAVLVNGLLSPPVTSDEAADAAAAAAGAVELVAAGYTALKVKVARRPDPTADARILAAIRSAVGPHVVLRADANRGWQGLEAATAFGAALGAAGVVLEYVEEPLSDARDMAAFYQQTGTPVAADESLDEGLLLAPSAPTRTPTSLTYGGGHTATGSSGRNPATDLPSYNVHGLPINRAAGLAALVVKPAVVGGIEAAVEAARWAQRRGIQVVISSAFESSVGIAHLVQLAVVTDANSTSGGSGAAASVHHGLGTLQWFAADVSSEPLELVRPQQLLSTSLSGPGRNGAAATSERGASAPATSSNAGSGGGAGNGSGCVMTPQFSALHFTVEDADRLLRDCAQGLQLREDALAGHRERHNYGASSSASAISNIHHDPCSSSGTYSSTGNNPVTDANPWASPHPGGGIIQRDLHIDVRIPAQPAVTSTYHHDHHSLQQHNSTRGEPQGAPSPGIPTLPVRVHGLEVLPPPERSSSPSGTGCPASRPAFLFLHGFLGSSADWLPLMVPLAAAGHHCVALDLPGHGATRPWPLEEEEDHNERATPATAAHSIPGAAECVAAAAAQLGLSGCVLVGYSLGARVALQAAVEASGLWSGVVLVSGTPGIKNRTQAVARAANDDRLADSLVRHGLADFVRRWYEQPLWSSLRRHPSFGRMLVKRCSNAATTAAAETDVHGNQDVRKRTKALSSESSTNVSNDQEVAVQLALALSGMSTGRMAPLWDRLDPWVGPPVVLVVGDLDAKFVDINTHTLARLIRQRTTEAAKIDDPSAMAAETTTSGGATAVSGLGSRAAGRVAQQPLSNSPPQPQPATVLAPTTDESNRKGSGGSSGSGSHQLSVGQQMAQLGHALVRVEGVGHAVHVESPERLLGVLQEVVAALKGSRAEEGNGVLS